MLIIDGHEDIAYNALECGRDIRLSAYATREREASQQSPYPIAMSGLPELRRGGVGIVFGVIFCMPHSGHAPGEGNSPVSYADAEEAYRVGQHQFAYYRQLAEEPGVSLILNQRNLKDVLSAWETSSADDKQRPLGIVPLMEGADPIRTPDEAAAWFAAGLRIVGLSWSGTRYSGGTFGLGPLTSAGKALLTEMERVGLTLDTTHLSEESFWSCLDHFHGHIIASHCNCRALTMQQHQLSDSATRTASERQLSDEMIRALVERDAVIGVMPVNSFLTAAWSRSHPFPVGLDQVVRHIDHICQIAGDSLHVGIGSDIDGGFGRDETPDELDTVADMGKLAAALQIAGYKEEEISNIMGGNWRRFLEHALPA
ncbi:MAG TPA: membrane dipeptidase [Ktedonosporobacter sp.]|nr:membrane dipeptidase [Ktedonosporobacter sp.]